MKQKSNTGASTLTSYFRDFAEPPVIDSFIPSFDTINNVLTLTFILKTVDGTNVENDNIVYCGYYLAGIAPLSVSQVQSFLLQSTSVNSQVVIDISEIYIV
jgi:hypothetical protein